MTERLDDTLRRLQKERDEADRRYKVGGRPGSATDCGRVFLLLGEPNSVEKQQEEVRSGPRTPEVWTFKDRPGMTFKDGQAQIAFDAECRLPQGARLGEQLNQLAEGRIVHPNLDYKIAGDGKLVKLADLLPKPSPLQTLLKQRRESVEQFTKGGRTELAEKETREIAIIETYLPAGASDAEMDKAIEAAIAETGANSPKQMGAVVKSAKALLSGKTVDGKALSDRVRARLEQAGAR